MASSSSSHVSFAKPTADAHSSLAEKTAGLVTKDEFTRRREELEREAGEGEAGGSSGGGESVPSCEAEKKKKKKKKKGGAGGALSFCGDEDEGDGEEAFVPKKVRKNPSVDASFLPDRERDEANARRREELAEEYRKQVEATKAQLIDVTYSYHDPSGRDGQKGHRFSVQIPKGFTIQDFLGKCREQCVPLRSCSVDQLMYVKEDLILPQGLTFYELIVNKARGKSGPLFHFDVHEDIRVGAFDHRVEKDESHAGKVMEKRVYERLKDKFPYSRFEIYDPNKKYDEYTIHGQEVKGHGVNTALV